MYLRSQANRRYPPRRFLFSSSATPTAPRVSTPSFPTPRGEQIAFLPPVLNLRSLIGENGVPSFALLMKRQAVERADSSFYRLACYIGGEIVA
jgi:hypothetical protein